jgi:hypothetical protein
MKEILEKINLFLLIVLVFELTFLIAWIQSDKPFITIEFQNCTITTTTYPYWREEEVYNWTKVYEPETWNSSNCHQIPCECHKWGCALMCVECD